MRLYLLLILFTVLPAQATLFSQVKLSSTYVAEKNKVLVADPTLIFIAGLTSSNSELSLVLNKVTRDGNRFKSNDMLIEIKLNDQLPGWTIDNTTITSFANQITLNNSLYLSLHKKACDTCNNPQNAIITLTTSGDNITIVTDPFGTDTQECPIYINPYQGEFNVLAHCTDIFNSTLDFVKTSDSYQFDTLSLNRTLYGSQNVYDGYVVPNGSFVVEQVDNKNYSIYQYYEDPLLGTGLFPDITGKIDFSFDVDTICSATRIDDFRPSLVCSNETQDIIKSFSTSTVNGNRNISYYDIKPTHSQLVSEEEFRTSTPIESISVGLHVFSALETTDNVLFANTDKDTSKNYTEHSVTGTLLTKSNYNDYVIAFLTKDSDQQLSLSLFDHLSVDLPPELVSPLSATVYSNTLYDIEVRYQDDRTLNDDIDVTFDNLPSWLSFDPTTKKLTGTPSHEQLGDFEFTLKLTDNNGQTTENPVKITVKLTPSVLMIKEPLMLKDYEDGVSFEELTKQLPVIEWNEDQVINFSFYALNRENDQYTLTIDNAPLWLTYNAQNKTLSGTPLQSDTKQDYHLTLHYTDHYLIDQETQQPIVKDFELTLHVNEIDEPFTVTSNGNKTIHVGEQYVYTLTIQDEESTLDELTIEPVLKPDWLTFDPTTFTFSGTPSQQDIKASLVQVVLTDKGGNSLVHAFTITVIPEKQTTTSPKKGGGSFSWTLLLFISFALFIKYKRFIMHTR